MSDDEPDREDVEEALDVAAEALAGAGLLTEQQARAWVLRDVLELDRPTAAARMGIGLSVLDDHLRRARDKIVQAKATADVLDQLQDRLDDDG